MVNYENLPSHDISLTSSAFIVALKAFHFTLHLLVPYFLWSERLKAEEDNFLFRKKKTFPKASNFLKTLRWLMIRS